VDVHKERRSTCLGMIKVIGFVQSVGNQLLMVAIVTSMRRHCRNLKSGSTGWRPRQLRDFKMALSNSSDREINANT